MLRFLAWRLVQSVIVLWAVYTVTFALLMLTPGDPFVTGDKRPPVQPREVACLVQMYGLEADVDERIARTRPGGAERDPGGVQRPTDGATVFVAVDPGHGAGTRKRDQRAARLDDIQTEKTHQNTDGRLAFADRKQARAEIIEGGQPPAQVAHGQLVFVDGL